MVPRDRDSTVTFYLLVGVEYFNFGSIVAGVFFFADGETRLT
jgi:hypothetical protein